MEKQNEIVNVNTNQSDAILCEKSRNGDPSARIELQKKYQEKIESQVLYFLKQNHIKKDHEIRHDLMNAALMGFIKASESFDYSNGACLMTFASKFIKSQIINSYKEYIGISYVTQREYKYIQKLRSIIVSRQVEPSLEEIANELSLGISDTKYLYNLNTQIIEQQKKAGIFEENTHQEFEENIQTENSYFIPLSNVTTALSSINIELISSLLKMADSKTSSIVKTVKSIIEEMKDQEKNIICELLEHPDLVSNKFLVYSYLSNKYHKSERTIIKIESRFIRKIREIIKKTAPQISHS